MHFIITAWMYPRAMLMNWLKDRDYGKRKYAKCTHCNALEMLWLSRIGVFRTRWLCPSCYVKHSPLFP